MTNRNAVDEAFFIIEKHIELACEALEKSFDELNVPIDLRTSIVLEASDSLMADAYTDWRYEVYGRPMA